jgi:hypothetical protein
MKAIILSILIGLLMYAFPSLGKAQTTIDSTLYVITLVNGNEYTGFIVTDDGREVLIEADNIGKIYIPKSDIARMNKKLKVDQILNNKFQSVIILNDGSEIIGRILSDDGKEMVLETDKLGKVYLDKKDISTIEKKVAADEIINGEYAAEGPFTTRYSFTNNALPIKKGENYAMINLFGPEVHFAVTNRLNVGIMSTWIGSPMALALKYTFKTKESKVNFSLGSIVGTSGYIRNFGGFGSLNWMSATFGDRKNNLTISGGYGFIKSGNSTYDYMTGRSKAEKMSHGPAFSVAGIVRVGAKTSLIFDAVCFTYSKYYDRYSYTYDNVNGSYSQTVVTNVKNQITALLLMPGLRFQSTPKKAFQISLAGVSVINSDNYYNRNRSFPIPMCSWFYKL